MDEDRHPKSDPTVRQAIEQWLEVAQLEDTTRDRYDDLIRIYVDPTVGPMTASKLDVHGGLAVAIAGLSVAQTLR